MEPVTHALASLALGKAGVGRGMRGAVPMLLASGLAAELDWAAYLGGPQAFLEVHRTASHSLIGTVVIAAAVAAVITRVGRKADGKRPSFKSAFLVCLAGASLHLLLDLGNPYGVKLLWPFSGKWFAWDLVTAVDPWMLFLLAAGLLLPGLFRLVTEEIGAKSRRMGRGAVVALVLAALYLGGRWMLYDRASTLLMARMYHGAMPLAAGAFPQAASPFAWNGVVVTENTIEEVTVPVGPGGEFDPERSRTFFKPEATPQLEAALESEVAKKFVSYARFPLASVERIERGWRVTLRDMRFAGGSAGRGVEAVVEVNQQAQVIGEKWQWAGGRN